MKTFRIYQSFFYGLTKRDLFELDTPESLGTLVAQDSYQARADASALLELDERLLTVEWDYSRKENSYDTRNAA